MKKKLIMIKLGGSVITDKSKIKGKFRKKVVARLAKEIADAKLKKNFDLIICHGAGSFGHPIARKYNLHHGYTGKESVTGFVLTHQLVTELSLLIWQQFLKAGLASCLVQTNAVAVTSSRKISQFETPLLENLIEKEIIPILGGDVVFDREQGIAILSADSIVSFLAKKLGAAKVIFASDVNGVFDKNPKIHNDAKLIGRITESNYQQILKSMEVYNRSDVTGEMRGKILAIRQELKGVEVIIVNGLESLAVQKVLLGRGLGTRIIF